MDLYVWILWGLFGGLIDVCVCMQLSSIGVENDEGARRNLREMLFTSPNVSDYISGVVRVVH